MFSSITQNPPERVGKGFSEMSVTGKATSFFPGLPEWNIKKVSNAHQSFVDYGPQPRVQKCETSKQTSINLGDNKI